MYHSFRRKFKHYLAIHHVFLDDQSPKSMCCQNFEIRIRLIVGYRAETCLTSLGLSCVYHAEELYLGSTLWLLHLKLTLFLLSIHFDIQNDERHLALLTALSRHPPSLGVFRLMFGGSFMLFITTLALGWGNEELKGRVEGLLFAGLDEEGEAEEEDDEVDFDHENDCGEVENNGDGGHSNKSTEYVPQPSFYSARTVSCVLH